MVHKVTLIPGDGIGLEVSEAARAVVEASGCRVEWDVVEAGEGALARYGTTLPNRVIDSIRENGVALKGPVTTPIGDGFRSVNVALRQWLDLYANVRPVMSLPGIPSRYEKVDLVIFRENTEDLYAGIERLVDADTAESIKKITRRASERIARAAFSFARREGRKKVTAGHKANIMKLSDGLFLESARRVAAEFPEITYEEVIVDALCMRLVLNPGDFDVLLFPNLYGDIVSDLCAGLVGGLGVVPGANLGEKAAVFEPVHGSAPQMAGKDLANPTAMILSAAMLLRHLGETEAAERVEQGVRAVLAARTKVTPDLGGKSGTKEMTAAIVEAMERSYAQVGTARVGTR
ncbi:MAG: isocitrate/isopropylmalate dehydrogenase family protein [Syntrophothermus sp.]